MKGTRQINQKTWSPRRLVTIGAAIVVSASWLTYAAAQTLSHTDSPVTRPEASEEATRENDAGNVPIPGERSRVEICVDSAALSVTPGESQRLVEQAVQQSRASRPEIWVSFFVASPLVTLACPVPVITFSPEAVFERRVDKVSEPLLFVFVQPDSARIQGGYARRPYEMLGGLNAYEATTILFIDVPTLLDSSRLRAAIHDALGLDWTPADNPDGPPDPNATKPSEKKVP